MEKTLMLCEARHELSPALADEVGYKGESVFPHYFNPFDDELMEKCLETSLSGVTKLNLIVTGMSTAFQSVIKYCNQNNIGLVCLHYDVKTKHYHPYPMQ